MMQCGNPNVWGGRHSSADVVPGGGSSSQEPPPPPQPRRRSIDNIVSEFGAWATYQNMYQTITSVYLSLMRGMSRQMGLDTTTYPPTSAFLPPFQFNITIRWPLTPRLEYHHLHLVSIFLSIDHWPWCWSTATVSQGGRGSLRGVYFFTFYFYSVVIFYYMHLSPYFSCHVILNLYLA